MSLVSPYLFVMNHEYLGVFQRWLDRRLLGRSNQELLQAYVISKDESAFVALVARYAESVYSICRSHARHHTLAEDAFQLTFTELARHARRIQGHDALGAWLCTTAKRIAWKLRWKERVRSAMRFVAAPVDREKTNDLTARDDQIDLYLDRLAPRYAEPLRLHYLSERTIKEVSQDLGISEAATKKRIERGLQQLRERARCQPWLSGALGTTLATQAKALSPEAIRHLAQAALRQASSASFIASFWWHMPVWNVKWGMAGLLLGLSTIGSWWLWHSQHETNVLKSSQSAESLQSRNLRLFDESILPVMLEKLRPMSMGNGSLRLVSREAHDTRLFCTFEFTHFSGTPYTFRSALCFFHDTASQQTQLALDEYGNQKFRMIRPEVPIGIKAFGLKLQLLPTQPLLDAIAAFEAMPPDKRVMQEALAHREAVEHYARRLTGSWQVQGRPGERLELKVVDGFLHCYQNGVLLFFDCYPFWYERQDGTYSICIRNSSVVLCENDTVLVLKEAGERWVRIP